MSIISLYYGVFTYTSAAMKTMVHKYKVMLLFKPFEVTFTWEYKIQKVIYFKQGQLFSSVVSQSINSKE